VTRLSRFCVLVGLIGVLASAAAAQTPPPLLPPAASSLGQGPPVDSVSLPYFEERLAPFGHWLHHPVWGDVWQPDAGRTFRPYFYGYWQYTSDYGWLWLSNEPYGDIVYHYGRWLFDPNYGWLWVPGYVWGPSWVAWRETDGYVGWLPMPPGYQDFSSNVATPSYSPSDLYGYQNFYGNNFGPDAFTSLWIFVPTEDFARSNRRPYVFDRDRLRDLYRRSRDRTHYVQDREHDRIVDRSIDKDALERSTHRSFGSQESGHFLRREIPIPSVSQGQELWRRNRDNPRLGGGNDSPAKPMDSRFGRERSGLAGRYVGPQIGEQNLPAPEIAPPDGRADDNANRRELGRFWRGRNPSAVMNGARVVPPENAPSTEVLRRAEDRLGPGGALTQVTPPSNPVPGAPVPGNAPGRLRLPGLGLVRPPPAVAAPNLANGTAPRLFLPRPPGVQPLGLQQSPGVPSAVLQAPPARPAVAIPAPQSQAAQPGRSRGLME